MPTRILVGKVAVTTFVTHKHPFLASITCTPKWELLLGVAGVDDEVVGADDRVEDDAGGVPSGTETKNLPSLEIRFTLWN